MKGGQAMKDKLIKTGHKKAFYRLRTTGLAFLFILGTIALLSLPVIVTYTATSSVAAKGQPSSSTSSHPQKDNGFRIVCFQD